MVSSMFWIVRGFTKLFARIGLGIWLGIASHIWKFYKFWWSGPSYSSLRRVSSLIPNCHGDPQRSIMSPRKRRLSKSCHKREDRVKLTHTWIYAFLHSYIFLSVSMPSKATSKGLRLSSFSDDQRLGLQLLHWSQLRLNNFIPEGQIWST